jgi:hypothetical protein
MSFEGGTTIDIAPPGPANNLSVQDEDIVKYDAGVWSVYFDGTAAGLAGGGENVDAFEILSGTSLIVSTDGTASVTGIPGGQGQDEDLLRCDHAGAVPITSCTSWSLYMDGTAVGLNAGGDAEDVDGVAVPSGGSIYLSTRGNFSVGGGSLTGADEDVFICNSPTGSPTVTGCTSFSLYFDGSAPGIGVTDDLDAFDLVFVSGSFDNLAPIVDAGLSLSITLPATADLAGSVSDDGLPAVPGVVTALWTATGPGTVTFSPNPNVLTPTASFSAAGLYTLTLTAGDGQLTASDLITVTVNDGGAIPTANMYLSLLDNGAAGTLTGVQDEDIIAWMGGSNYIMVFDGSSAGLPGLDVDAFYIVAPNTILMSFTAGTNGIPGIPTTVDDSDIVQFTGTSFGLNNTSGTFSLFFDGSDVGLAVGGGEDIDGIELLPDNRLLISTNNAVSVPGAAGADEDLLVFTPISTGPNTTGTWAVYFDGSDVSLGGAGEDVDGLSVAADGNIYLSTEGNFNVPSLSGADEDVFICGNSGPTVPTTGPATVCPAYSLFFDGSANGIPAGNDVDAIELPN